MFWLECYKMVTGMVSMFVNLSAWHFDLLLSPIFVPFSDLAMTGSRMRAFL